MNDVIAGITYGGRTDAVDEAIAGCEANDADVLVWHNARRTPASHAFGPDGLVNYGHTRAVLEMMRHGFAEGYDLFLQCSDDAAPQPGYLDAAREVMARFPRVACVCTPAMNVGPFPELTDACRPLAPDGTRPREGLILECAFVACVFRLEAMADVGFVDSRFFFHSFDTDACWTLWAHGWRVYQLAGDLVAHRHGARNAADLLNGYTNAQLRHQDAWRLFEKWSHADWGALRETAPYLHQYAVGKHGLDTAWTSQRAAEVHHLLR